MKTTDLLLWIQERQTVTAKDFAADFETTEQMAGYFLRNMTKRGYIARVSVSGTYVYGLAPKGEKWLAKVPAIDPGERCLNLTFEGVCPEVKIASGCCPDWNTSHMRYVTLETGGMIGAWECPHCGYRFPVAVYNPH